jgi:uncharacterized protein (DUF4415 family)
MAIVTSTLKAGSKPTPEQIEHVRRAALLPITYDEDCPELTNDELLEFRRVADTTPEERKQIAVEAAKRRSNVTLAPDVLAWLTENWSESYQEQVNIILRQAMQQS